MTEKKKSKKKWIPKDMKEGAFTKKAKAHDMTVSQYAHEVLKNDSKASETTKRQARLALTFRKIAKSKKKK